METFDPIFNVKDKTIIVTGAARGLGQKYALEFAKGALDLLKIAEEELFESLQRDDVDALLRQELCALGLRREAVDLLEVEVLFWIYKS